MSVALTVNVNVPTPVGVPDRSPVLARVIPAGSAPLLTDHEVPPSPSAACRVCEYAVPCGASGNGRVVTNIGAAIAIPDGPNRPVWGPCRVAVGATLPFAPAAYIVTYPVSSAGFSFYHVHAPGRVERESLRKL